MTSKLFDDKGRLKVSASQIQSFQNCPNFWFLNKVQGHPTKVTPALAYGKKFHSCIEKSYEFLDEGVERKQLRKMLTKEKKFGIDHVDMTLAGWKKGILVNPPKKLIEKEIKIPIGDFGLMRGYIDFYNVNHGSVEDHKTIGDWQWALKQEDLRKNLQLMIYCYWVLTKLKNRDEVIVRHNQFFKPDPDQSQFIEDVVDRDYVFDYWKEHVEKTVSVMVEYVKELPEEYMELEIEKNPLHCSAYGGCCYLNDKCDGKEE
jgi:hypothetical protein